VSARDLIKRCETLYNDLDLPSVKEWRAKTGGKAIGFMPIYVPRELIHAAGLLPVGIMGGGDGVEIIRGDSFFQSYICHIPRSTIELGLTGKLDVLDGMLFPAICDVIRNLSGMWLTLFRDKYVRYVDLPQNFKKGVGGEFYRDDLEEMLAGLEKVSGVKATPARLNASIALYNENRRAVDRLYQMRVEMPHVVSTSDAYLLLRASNVLEVSEHTALVERYMEEALRERRPKLDNVRVVTTGAFCEQPPLGLIRALEAAGCYIVDDDWVLAARFLRSDVPQTDDPIGALTEAYLGKTVATASRYEDEAEKGEFLSSRVRETRAEGVVFCAPSFCDPALLERPMLQSALAQRGIPYTGFNYAENTGQFRSFAEQTGTFADSIKLWGGQ
jgi:benzoyl-CoA reductase subunit C